MARAKHLLLGATVWLAACGDASGPAAGGLLGSADRPLHHLRWPQSSAPPQFAVQAHAAGSGIAAAPSEPSALDHYQLSFWAHQSEARAITVHYAGTDGAWRPYLTFGVPAGGLAQRPGGAPFGTGDSVLITLTVDTTNLLIRFEPSGLAFNPLAPAWLEISYSGADPDLDGGGTVDAADQDIEDRLLGVWVQQQPGTPWQPVSAARSPADKAFTANLGHFSGYAVSY